MDGLKSLSQSPLVPFSNPSSAGRRLDDRDPQSFIRTLSQAIEQVNSLQQEADKKAQELATGKSEDIAGVMIAMEKADIALRLMMQVRNKLLESYQEIMKTQV